MPVTIVLPTFGEYEALSVFLPMLRATLPEVNIMIVWDGPDDGTAALAFQYGAWSTKGDGQGLGAAIVRGIKSAPNDLVIVMDGDGQHPVDPLPAMINALEAGVPFIAGVRAGRQAMPWHRATVSMLCASMVYPLSRLSDPMTGFFGLDRRAVNLDTINVHTWKIGLELVVRSGLEAAETQYSFRPRIAGQSHSSIKPALQFLRQVALLYAFKLDFQQMLRFGVVGSSGILVNMAVTILLVEVWEQNYKLAALAGIGVAMQWNYLWNKFWTFSDRRTHGKKNRTSHKVGDSDSLRRKVGKC